MKTLKIFIVEDDEWYAELLKYHLGHNPDYELTVFSSGKALLDQLHLKPDVVTLDYSLPDYSGGDLLKKLKTYNPDLPVIVISAQKDVSTAINLLKEGAYEYIVKDDDTKERVWNTIKNVREKLALKNELNTLRNELQKKYAFEKMLVGTSPAIRKIFNLLEKAVKTNITVSISGETGTGKELVAKSIHYNSIRQKQAFVAINVSAIPSELIESELFGHEKGAFTGATMNRKGKFEQAHKGTLFLDEIGDMDKAMQSKLLRVLQEKELTPIGSNKTIKVDARLIVATHKDLAEEVRLGNFRSDLYYRLLGLPVVLPPLRDRGNDVLILAKFFLDAFCKDNQMPAKRLSEEARNKLMKYPYPGNVRELKAIIELAAVMSNDNTINTEDISFSSTNPIADLLVEELSLKEYTRKIVSHFMEKYDRDIGVVAEKLSVGKSTIYGMKQKGEI